MSNFQRTLSYVFLFFFCIILSACTVQATPHPFTQTPQPGKQFTTEVKTPTKTLATIELSPTNVYTVKPKSTSTPLLHPSDTHTDSQPAAINSLTVTTQTMLTKQTLTLKETQIAYFPINCGDLPQNEVSLSPHGNWLAISCGYNHDQTLTILDHTGKKWVMQYKDYLAEEQIRNGVPIGGIYPIYWLDEDYLYFSPSISFSGGGWCRYRWAGQGLFRIDLNTGYVSTTLLKLSGANGYILAFSPGGRWLVYNAGNPMILDLQTGKKVTLSVSYGDVGDFTWSPDGSELVYATCETDPNTYEVKRSSIQIYSLGTQVTRTLLEGEGKPFHIFDDNDTVLKVADSESEDDAATNFWFFDWSIGQFLTPTPKP